MATNSKSAKSGSGDAEAKRNNRHSEALKRRAKDEVLDLDILKARKAIDSKSKDSDAARMERSVMREWVRQEASREAEASRAEKSASDSWARNEVSKSRDAIRAEGSEQARWARQEGSKDLTESRLRDRDRYDLIRVRPGDTLARRIDAASRHGLGVADAMALPDEDASMFAEHELDSVPGIDRGKRYVGGAESPLARELARRDIIEEMMSRAPTPGENKALRMERAKSTARDILNAARRDHEKNLSALRERDYRIARANGAFDPERTVDPTAGQPMVKSGLTYDEQRARLEKGRTELSKRRADYFIHKAMLNQKKYDDDRELFDKVVNGTVIPAGIATGAVVGGLTAGPAGIVGGAFTGGTLAATGAALGSLANRAIGPGTYVNGEVSEEERAAGVLGKIRHTYDFGYLDPRAWFNGNTRRTQYLFDEGKLMRDQRLATEGRRTYGEYGEVTGVVGDPYAYDKKEFDREYNRSALGRLVRGMGFKTNNYYDDPMYRKYSDPMGSYDASQFRDDVTRSYGSKVLEYWGDRLGFGKQPSGSAELRQAAKAGRTRKALVRAADAAGAVKNPGAEDDENVGYASSSQALQISNSDSTEGVNRWNDQDNKYVTTVGNGNTGDPMKDRAYANRGVDANGNPNFVGESKETDAQYQARIMKRAQQTGETVVFVGGRQVMGGGTRVGRSGMVERGDGLTSSAYVDRNGRTDRDNYYRKQGLGGMWNSRTKQYDYYLGGKKQTDYSSSRGATRIAFTADAERARQKQEMQKHIQNAELKDAGKYVGRDGLIHKESARTAAMSRKIMADPDSFASRGASMGFDKAAFDAASVRPDGKVTVSNPFDARRQMLDKAYAAVNGNGAKQMIGPTREAAASLAPLPAARQAPANGAFGAISRVASALSPMTSVVANGPAGLAPSLPALGSSLALGKLKVSPSVAGTIGKAVATSAAGVISPLASLALAGKSVAGLITRRNKRRK